MKPHSIPALALLALCSVAPAPAGQSTPANDGDARLVLFLAVDVPPSVLALFTGTVLDDHEPGFSLYAFAPGPGQTVQDLEVLAGTFAVLPSTLVAEVDRRAAPPESADCGSGPPVPGAVIQQCTVGFVDGTPSEAEFLGQPWLDVVQAPAAQALAGSYEPVVAVIDSGIDFDHPLFAGRIFDPGWDYVNERPGAAEEKNGVDDDGDGVADEGYGHGTHVAGTILAVNPGARILPIKVVDSEGNGWGFDVARAIYLATVMGADVINLSLSMQSPSGLVSLALDFAVAAGVDVFASAGNTGAAHVMFPASQASSGASLIPVPPIYPHGVVAVSAVDDLDLKAGFAAWGAPVDVVAPGVDVYSAVPGGGYSWWSGTSMATAVASGAGSLVSSVQGPSFALKLGEEVVGGADPVDLLNPGYAGLLGEGRVNCLAAVSP